MIRWHGIGVRLLVAFALIAILGLSASAVGWLMLRDVARTQETVTSSALPAVDRAQGVARISAQMVAAVPVLTSATSQEQRTQRARDLFADASNLRTVLRELREAPVDDDVVDALGATADSLIDNLHAQNELVARQLRLRNRAQRAVADSQQAAHGVADLSEALVGNARSRATAVLANLYGLIDERGAQVYEALDRLAEVDLYLMERMFALRLRSVQIGNLLAQLRTARTLDEINRLGSQVDEHVRVLTRRVESIRDPVRRSQAQELLTELAHSDGGARPQLFEVHRQIVETRSAIEEISAENRRLAGLLDRQATALVGDVRAFSTQAAQDARHAADAGLWTVLAVSGASLLATLMILWLYVERRIARRLDGLSGAMRSLAQGDLSVSVQPDGRDELAEMASAINVFRDDAIRRRKLEAERDAVEQELREHREELQRQVAERTAQLTAANESLRHEITEHEQARADAERASRAKSEFLATVSHEIRTPISGMLGMLRVLRDSDASPAAQHERLALVESSAQTLLSILNGILDYSKAEAGQVDLDEQDFDACDLIARLVGLMQPSAQQKGVELRTECSPHIPQWLHGDAGKLRQVLFNLVGNALKFTDEGEVVLRAGPAEDPGDDAIRMHFEVADTGIGLSEEDVEAIFQPFHQGADERHRQRGGTGLGLPIAQSLIEAMDGRMTVESSSGAGSRFTFEVPLRRGSPPAQEEGRATAIPESERLPSKRVLLVEDDPVHRFVVSTFLEQLGHVVDPAASGEEALERAEARLPEVVLMDISLPGMDGLTAARRLRDRGGTGLPVVAMSAHVFRGEIKSYREAGMDAVVIKPVWPETLNAGLAEAFSARPATVIGGVGVSAVSADDSTNPVLNRAQLEADVQALGAEAATKVVDLFLATSGERVTRIREAAAAGDCRAMEGAAHELKSAAQSLALEALAEACIAAENAAAGGETASLVTLAAAVESTHQEAVDALRAYRPT